MAQCKNGSNMHLILHLPTIEKQLENKRGSDVLERSSQFKKRIRNAEAGRSIRLGSNVLKSLN